MPVKTVLGFMSLMLIAFGTNAVVTTTTSEDYLLPSKKYSLGKSELFNMVSTNQNALIVSELGAFVISPPLEFEVKDKAALTVIAKLMLSKDDRAPLALANYLKRYPQDLFALYLASVRLIEKKQYSKAKAALTKIIDSHSDFAAAHTLLGLADYSENNFVEGNAHFINAVSQKKPDLRAFKYLIWYALQQRDIVLATSLAEYVVSFTDTALLSIHALELSELYRLQGRYSEIVSLLYPIVAALESNERTILEGQTRLLEAQSMIGETHEGVALFNTLSKTPAKSLMVVSLAHSRLLNQSGKHTEAIELLNNMAGQPKNVQEKRLVLLEKLKTYALLNSNTGIIDTAQNYLTTVESENNWRAITPLSVFLVQIGQGNALINMLEEKMSSAKNTTELALVITDLYLAAGDKYEAKRMVDKILASYPNVAEAHYKLGILHYNNRQNEAAREAFEKAIAVAPNTIDYWMALIGAMHDHREHSHATGMAASDHESILPVFDRALKENPQSATLYFEKGLTAYSGSQLTLAAEMFEKALLLKPLYLEAIAMQAITLVDANARLDHAHKLIEQGLRMAPKSGALVDAKGWLLTKNGDVKEAEALLYEALSLMPNDEAVLAHLAQNTALQQQSDKSRNYALSALQGSLPAHTAAELRLLLNSLAPEESLQLAVHKINNFGVGIKLGSVIVENVKGGVRVTFDVTGLPMGKNGLHFHEKPSCDTAEINGVRKAGAAAGEHYGHNMKGMMMDMDMSNMSSAQHAKHMELMKPKGDLPPLLVTANGDAKHSVIGKGLSLQELRGRSLMIHEGPDVDGVSGPKFACVVIN